VILPTSGSSAAPAAKPRRHTRNWANLDSRAAGGGRITSASSVDDRKRRSRRPAADPIRPRPGTFRGGQARRRRRAGAPLAEARDQPQRRRYVVPVAKPIRDGQDGGLGTLQDFCSSHSRSLAAIGSQTRPAAFARNAKHVGLHPVRQPAATTAPGSMPSANNPRATARLRSAASRQFSDRRRSAERGPLGPLARVAVPNTPRTRSVGYPLAATRRASKASR